MASRSLRVGSFNVLNLAPAGVKFYEDQWSPKEFEEKSAWIGGQLRRMGGQIVGFQEVWRESTLRSLCAATGLFTQDQVWAPGTDETSTTKFNRGPFVGIASTLPLVGSVETIVDFPAGIDAVVEGVGLPVGSFSRPVLRARFGLDATRTVTVFVAHLKSKRPLVAPDSPKNDPREEALGKARSLIRRASEAAALRFLVLDEVEGNHQPVIVIGDLNDGVTSVTTEMIAGSPPWRFAKFEDKVPIWDRLLYNAWELHAVRSTREVGYTHIFNGFYESLDHVLVSQEFVGANKDRVGEVVNVEYLNDHLIDGMLSDARANKEWSDHGQIVAEIRMRDPA
jgi:hypothetical protein